MKLMGPSCNIFDYECSLYSNGANCTFEARPKSYLVCSPYPPQALREVETVMQQELGNREAPLLLSVRNSDCEVARDEIPCPNAEAHSLSF